MAKLVHTLFFTLQLTKIVSGFSWNAQKALHSAHRAAYNGHTDEIDTAWPPRYRLQSDNIYSVALQELESLESQPLCHQIAARLLVNNCHLLHGQDETVELANTGRLTRDFIDSYAAGLAICDLERGSFVIPRECAKFREPALTKIEVGKTPHLHVSTVEIDKCLEGLAQSDSSWNTWISYRHKAVRFCEIAKSDNEKDSTIHLHKKITEIMERFSEKVEVQVEEQLRRVDHLMQRTTEAADSLLPHAETLKSQLDGLGRVLNEQLMTVSREQQSALEVQSGLDDATQLRNIVNVLLESIRENQVQIVIEHSNALQTVRKETLQGVETMIATIATAASSSVRLQTQLEETELRADKVMEKQNTLEKEPYKVLNLRLIESTALFYAGPAGAGGHTLLAPSIARNLLLLGLGEIAGLTISATQAIKTDTSIPFIHTSLPNFFKTTFNDTTQMIQEAHDPQTAHSSTFLQ
ncbi:Nuclear fusion protein, KAR5 [Beauveria brongniartii RCEF 3172]|uniref:Nuclear fusion protein, KAR5 n=1 Tax=Beauveria brongniartii RCEF 3172 TaxID=1081107 RepID=A0A162JS50_9HYPO|nr:Nuclear fusion protein, KAR5 [Beauveria brongniartii RCEF 3172]